MRTPLVFEQNVKLRYLRSDGRVCKHSLVFRGRNEAQLWMHNVEVGPKNDTRISLGIFRAEYFTQ